MKSITTLACAGLSVATLASYSHAQTTITLDVSGMSSWGFQGDPANDILEVLLAPGILVQQISWNLNITTVGLSWAEELTIGILGNSFIVNPAFGDAFTVTNMNYQGSLDEQFIQIGQNGILDFEFYEVGFDDNANAIDAFFEEGSTISVLIMPAPGPLSVIGLAGLMATRRKRTT